MSIKGKRVLYLSYNGMLDPLGQSQVVPYLKALSAQGVEFTLLSFERTEALAAYGSKECGQLRAQLAAQGINWHWLRYHKSPSLPATVYDVTSGICYADRLVRRDKIELVHARSHIPAVIALALKRRFGSKMIFDVRGLMADEYVDAGHWRKDSLPYRLTKNAERRALSAADGVVTLTERIWSIINQWDCLRNSHAAHAVVPCCADLELFCFNAADRESIRRELNIENRFVVIYSGSIDGWYLTEEMADFFVTVRTQQSNAYFLWLTPTRHDRIREIMEARGISDGDYGIIASRPRDVPAYLSAADAGLAFIKPCFSKLASSPTKYAEYLGCGLPLVINADIGDSDELITHQNIGALVKEFNELEYSNAWAVTQNFTGSPEQTRQRARKVAEELFDVRRVGLERYANLYESVLAK